MQAVFKYYLDGDKHALDSFPGGALFFCVLLLFLWGRSGGAAATSGDGDVAAAHNDTRLCVCIAVSRAS